MGLIYSNIPELEGSNTEIALTNLSELESDLEVLIEKRLAHLSELAKAIMIDGDDPDIIKSIILSIRSEGNADSEDIITENRHNVDAIFSKFSLIERLTIFQEAFGKIDIESMPLLKVLERHIDNHPNEVISDEASERIAYLKNSYNDMAYMQFSELFNSPRAAYFGSIVDVCESVYNGVCEYCILPVETSSDGKLISFYETILRYNLKISAVYDLSSNNGYTRYALLSKKFTFHHMASRAKNKNRLFEFIFTESDNLPLGDMLCAAEFCSLKLRRIDTLNIIRGNIEPNTYLCPVFSADDSDMQTFLSFLVIDCPEFIPLGLYIQI